MRERTIKIAALLIVCFGMGSLINNEIQASFWAGSTDNQVVDPESVPRNTATAIPSPAPNFATQNLLPYSYFDGVVDESGYVSSYSTKAASIDLVPTLISTSGVIITISDKMRAAFYGDPPVNGNTNSREHLWSHILPSLPGSNTTVFASTYELTEEISNYNNVAFGPRANNRVYALDVITGELLLIYQEETRAEHYPFDNAPHYAIAGRDGSHLIAHKTTTEALGAPGGVFFWYSERSNFVALDLANLNKGWESYRPPTYRILKDKHLTDECNAELSTAE